MGSGEALIEALSLIEEEDAPLNERGRIVFEAEMSKPLKVMRREGSILSEVIRSAWDSEPLENRTKGKQLIALAPHVSILAHTTEAELRDQLKTGDVFNGFGNRFLWISTRRVRLLPFGGGDAPIAPLVSRLHAILDYATLIDRVEFDDEVKEMWDQGGLYRLLTERPDTLFGVVTSRAEAHVTRLALLYAVLDAEKIIRMPHLLAALAVWDYSERTAKWLFGGSSGDEYADTIEELLQEAYPGFLTRTQIRDHFKRHAPAGRIPRALETLESQGRAERSSIATEGRHAESWTVLGRQLSDRSDISPLKRARELLS